MAGEFAVGGAAEGAAETIGARLGAIAGSVTGGGRFAYHPDELRALINDWSDLAQGYEDDIRGTWVFQKVRGPGEDYASASIADVVRDSARALRESLITEQAFCAGQAQKMQRALNAYLGGETRTAAEMNQQDPGTVF